MCQATSFRPKMALVYTTATATTAIGRRSLCRLFSLLLAKTGLRYSGLRAWMKYIGVKMPSRPASAIATAQRFKVSAT